MPASLEDLALRAAFGVLAFRRGTYPQAVQELTWVCERDPEDGNIQYYLGESLNRMGRYDDAIGPLELATQLRPSDPRAFYTLGRLYDRRHLPEAAAEMYRRATELHRG